MATSILRNNALDFTSDGATTEAKVVATSSVLTFSGLGATNCTLSGIADPVGSQDAATKAYVDASSSGLDAKPAVRVATVVSGTLSTSFANTSIVDGVTLVTNDRILLKDQSTGSDNGIYEVQSSGAPVRVADFTIGVAAAGVYIFVNEGTVNADTGFICVNNSGSDVVDTDALVFSVFSIKAGTAGDGLAQSASGVFSVNVDDATLEITTDTIRVKDGGVANVKLTNSSLTVTAGDGLQTGGSVDLGASVTVDVDSTVARQNAANTFTTGDQTIGANVVLSGTAADSGYVQLAQTIAPTSTADRLYNIGGTLTYNGTAVATTQAGTIGKLAFYAVPGTEVSDTDGITVSGAGQDAITATGDVTANNFVSTSDINLKQDLVELKDSLQKLRRIQGYTFGWKKNPEKKAIGVIAQDVQRVCPDIVYQVNDGNGTHLAIQYNGLVALLIEAVKSLDDQVQSLERRMDKLLHKN